MVDLDETLHGDELDLAGGESISQTVAEDDDEGKALARLVGTRGGLGGPGSAKLGQHPVAGSVEALQVFLGSTRLLLLFGVTHKAGRASVSKNGRRRAQRRARHSARCRERRGRGDGRAATLERDDARRRDKPWCWTERTMEKAAKETRKKKRGEKKAPPTAQKEKKEKKKEKRKDRKSVV